MDHQGDSSCATDRNDTNNSINIRDEKAFEMPMQYPLDGLHERISICYDMYFSDDTYEEIHVSEPEKSKMHISLLPLLLDRDCWPCSTHKDPGCMASIKKNMLSVLIEGQMAGAGTGGGVITLVEPGRPILPRVVISLLARMDQVGGRMFRAGDCWV